MRKIKKIATGIDIGSDTIKIVKVVRAGKSFAVSNCVVIPIKEYVRGNRLIHQPPEFLSRLVKAELLKSKLMISNPAVTTSAEDVLYKYLFLPKSVKRKIVPLLHLILFSQNAGDVVFGFSRVDAVSRIKKNELVIISMVKNDTLEFIHTLYEGLGQIINHSVPRPLALYNLITCINEGTGGEIYFWIDISSEGFDMAIAEKTNARKPASRLAFFRSVRRKFTENSSVQDVYQTVYDEVQQTIAACRNELKRPDLDIAHFRISGERYSDEGLARYLGERLGKEVRLFDPAASAGIKISGKNKSRGVDGSLNGMTVAIGLALGILDRLPLYIRLIPRRTEARKKDARNFRYLKIAMSFVLAAAFVILYYNYVSMNTYRNNARKAENTLTAYISNESRLLGIAEGQKKLGEQLRKLKNNCDKDFSLNVLEKLLDVKIPGDIILKDVAVRTVGGFQSLGSSRWVRLGGRVKAPEGSDNPLEILKGYVTNLEGVNGFSGVRFHEIRELSNQSLIFQIEFLTD